MVFEACPFPTKDEAGVQAGISEHMYSGRCPIESPNASGRSKSDTSCSSSGTSESTLYQIQQQQKQDTELAELCAYLKTRTLPTDPHQAKRIVNEGYFLLDD